jgi:hypothetical protein
MFCVHAGTSQPHHRVDVRRAIGRARDRGLGNVEWVMC